MFVVTNKGVYEYGEEIGERSRCLFQLEYNGVGDWSLGYEHYYPNWTGTVGRLFIGALVKFLNFNFLNTNIKNLLFNT